jgi:hypothetical protein
MKIVTTLFEYPNYPYQYKKLHAVLQESCKHFMPDVEFHTIYGRIVESNIKSDRPVGYTANTLKLSAINKYVQTADDDLLIIDADMMCTGPGYHAFDDSFDIAYTMRTKLRPGGPTINGGVMMVSNTQQARDWFQLYEIVNRQMYTNVQFHDRWNKKYTGMNQSAMGYMLEESWLKAGIHEYKTQPWNAVDGDWENIDDSTVFVHCKGQLRKVIVKNSGPATLAPIVKKWYDFLYETDCCCNDVEKRGYLVAEIPERGKKVCRPYTRHRQWKHGRNR